MNKENPFPAKNPFHFSHKDKIDELEVLAFEQKIKKIQRKKKFRENYKNIELIQSVYDAPVDEAPENTSSSVPPNLNTIHVAEPSCGCEKKDADVASYYEEKKKRTKRTVQSMKDEIYSILRGQVVENYTAGEKTEQAGENLDINTQSRDPFYWLFEFPYKLFQYFPRLIDAMIYDAAFVFANTFTIEEGATTQADDAQCIHDIIALTFSFPLCIYITYNWFFLLAFKGKFGCDRLDPPVPECRPANDAARMKLNFDSVLEPNTRKFLNLMFDFSIRPLETFDNLTFGDKRLPALCMLCPARILVKFILLLISFFVVTWFSLFDTVDASINGASGMLMGFCILCILYQYIKSIPGHAMKIIELTEGKPLVALAISILFFTVRLIIAIFSISTSSILITFYLWVHSLFGMSMYGDGTNGIADEIDNIDAYIDKDILWLRDKDEHCFKPELWRKVLRTIVFFIYDNFYALSFLFLMGGNILNVLGYKYVTTDGTSSYAPSIQSTSLKYTILLIISVQLYLVGVLMFYHSGKAEVRMTSGLDKVVSKTTTGGVAENIYPTVNNYEKPPEWS
jgi:hypothetical protein